MTHKDIYTKFMIEYDKANLTSSYPSLTEYEVATVLDKAYNALIAQKITGNNYRRSTLESDIKSTADLEPLIRRKKMTAKTLRDLNVMYADQPENMLYYIEALLYTNGITLNKDTKDASQSYDPYDGITLRTMPAQLVTHKAAEKFIVSSSNLPWIKNPVCYLENNKIFFVYDPINKPLLRNSETGLNENNQSTPVVTASLQDDENNPYVDGGQYGDFEIVYIKTPNKFVKDLQNPQTGWVSYFDWSTTETPDAYKFECNETMAEELISLAVMFALENVESQRLGTKLNMRGLEA